MDIEVGFPEELIAEVIVFMRAFCKAENAVPYIVAIVEGSSGEAVAWRKVAIDYLTAKAKGAKMPMMNESQGVYDAVSE